MLAIIKLNSIKNAIWKALIDNEISHENFTTVFNEGKSYRELKVKERILKKMN